MGLTVDKKLQTYIQKSVFPLYSKNDGGHNLAHIREVISRIFELNAAFSLDLDPNMLYAIAAFHDVGKYQDPDNHHLIAARFFENDNFKKTYFSHDDRKTIKEAIEDHRSSKKDEPRSIYGKLISSADRNSSIEAVFVRSFFVAHERMPDETISDYLDFTLSRLAKRYDENDTENMFFVDKKYENFLVEMRNLLKQPDEFKKRYCEVNHISSPKNKVKDEPGAVEFLNPSFGDC